MKSIIQRVGLVSFPEFTGERKYMIPFLQKEGLPKSLQRWQRTVDQMLGCFVTDQPIYIMIDQGEVMQGMTQRRPGPHIDGNWIAGTNSWNDDNGSWGTRNINNGRYNAGRHSHGTRKLHLKEEAIILASSVSACVAYEGEYDGEYGAGGDCSHLDLSATKTSVLESNVAYIGNVHMVHESIPVPSSCQRTLVRLNCPGLVF